MLCELTVSLAHVAGIALDLVEHVLSAAGVVCD